MDFHTLSPFTGRVLPVSIRLNDGTVLPAPLPLDRAERVARRAVSEHGRYDVAEIIGDDGEPFITYARINA